MKISSVFSTSLFLLTFIRINAISNYEGCEISGVQTTLQWKWSDTRIGCWFSQSSHLTLTVKFLEYSHPQAHDIIEIGTTTAKIVHKREYRKETVLEYLDDESIQDGWAFFHLSVSHQYEVGYSSETRNYRKLFTFPLDLTVQKITITGSNLTINCNNNAFVWHVDPHYNKDPVVVPFAGGLSLANISFYSNLDFRPEILIDGYEIPLNISLESGRLTTATTGVPLPAFNEQHMNIICESKTEKQITCNINSNESTIYTLKTLEQPRRILVRGQEEFFLILHTNTPAGDMIYTKEPITETPEECGNVAAWSLGIILIIIIIIICIVAYWKRKMIKVLVTNTEGTTKDYSVKEENYPLINETQQSQQQEQQQQQPDYLMWDNIISDPTLSGNMRLLKAVTSGNEKAVANILKTLNPDPLFTTGDKSISAYQDAHQRGNKPIVELIEKHLKDRSKIPKKNIIMEVMKEHESSVKQVFTAAKNGLYQEKNGVDTLLKTMALPGTIIDKTGQSLLHYVASAKLGDGAPLWISEDIKSLVDSHECYVDAVDYRGRSALHVLAESAVNAKDRGPTCWDNQEVSVSVAWLSLLKLLLEIGCNPTLSDHKNDKPENIAREKGNVDIANELQKACRVYSNNTENTFEDLIITCKSGKLSVNKHLLQNRVPMLPLGSRGDPLLEAVKSASRDDLLLLLSAGAPLCAHGLTGNTPLEAANNITQLPAIFPALLIKALIDKLHVEELMIKENNEESEEHKQTIRGISNSLRDGKTIAELFDYLQNQNSTYKRKLLRTASSLGLSLTCQLLGIAGVCLNSMQGESHPIKEALATNQYDTIYTLCRDLKMSPYCAAGLSEENLQSLFKNDLFESDIEKFRKRARKEITLIKYLEQIKENKTNTHPEKDLLHLLAKYGLVSLLHKISNVVNLDLNQIVHDASKCTGLHIAAAYGETNMVEYFLTRGAEPWLLSKGGLAAAHLAAIRGHKVCMEYILKYTGKDEACSIGMKASDFLTCYRENVKISYLDTMTSQEALMVKNSTDDYYKAKTILENQFNRLSIRSQDCLRNICIKDQELMNDSTTKSITEAITSDVELLLQSIENIDQRFKGKVINCDPIIEGYECFLPENHEFKIEIDQNVTVNIDDNEIVNVTSSMHTDLFKKSNFLDYFYTSLSKALEDIRFINISLIPPFQLKLKSGTSLYAIYRDGERALNIRIRLIPVIKVSLPPNNQLQLLCPKYDSLVRSITHEHITNTDDGKWSYLFTNTELEVFTNLDSDKKLVFHTCFFLVKLMVECWWIPKLNQRQIGQAFETFPVGVNVPSYGVMKSLFLKELSNAQEASWGENHFIDRLIAIFDAAPSPEAKMENFILPWHWKFTVGEMPKVVVEILRKFQNNQK